MGSEGWAARGPRRGLEGVEGPGRLRLLGVLGPQGVGRGDRRRQLGRQEGDLVPGGLRQRARRVQGERAAPAELAVGGDVDGNQEIGSSELHAVTGKIKHHLIAARDLGFEVAQRGLHHFLGEILFQGHIETYRLEFRSDRLRIRTRVLEGLHVLITVIADDQGKTFCMRGGGQRQRRRE